MFISFKSFDVRRHSHLFMEKNSITQMKVFVCMVFFTWAARSLAFPCHPAIDPQRPQYMIGYGSLIDEQSKKRTDPTAEESLPVLVTGYRRSWSVHSHLPGLNTTYLSIVEDPHASFNGVIYKLSQAANIHKYDLREKIYCRRALNSHQLKTFVGTFPEQKQIWIYVTKKQKLEPPTHDTPIVQSYVDIFVRGCIQAEEKFNINHFAKDCIKTTTQWSIHWENDRIFPRRPTFNEPYADKIDALLQELLPENFKRINIVYQDARY